ncbi:MAG: His-Xaa-Ser system radical SAM maturase HxsB [Bdellovibrionales bacterium]|nr:His-Xaa-Ser system radical SAM maturase HxsB [Bdellovibrionales bacterium]
MTDKLTTPFRFREIGSRTLVSNEVGDYGFFEAGIAGRILGNDLLKDEETRLSDLLIKFDETEHWKLLALAKRVKDRLSRTKQGLSYIIIIPTLRCDLSCTYCQVSRAPLHAKGFDWDEEKLSRFSNFLDGLQGDKVKIEFQGGEPTLRPDLIKQIISMGEERFPESEFVICTNLMSVTKEMAEIYRRPNVYISTSIDGPEDVMASNRTHNQKSAKQFFENFKHIKYCYGIHKVSALPTITEEMLRDPKALIDLYLSLGFSSIFLRPVNYMGFARKTFKELSKDVAKWNQFYREAIEYIVQINKDTFFEEFYFSLVLKNIFQIDDHGFVDFRSPNFFLSDYCVIDFDGRIYPSDEARMLSRTGHVDLSLGEMGGPIDKEKLRNLNWHSMNQVDSDCLHCAYMPFCGVDMIDDLSRYNRIDSPKLDTWFCMRHMMIFDLIFEKVASKDIEWLDVFLKWVYRKIDPPKTYELFYDKAEI